MKLDEFRLETYDERFVLTLALAYFKGLPQYDEYRGVVEALSMRLSRTQCQPGGCEYCE